MLKRLFSLLCVLILCFSAASAEKEKPAAQRYDFDLVMSLNPEAFSPRARIRARGYAELLDSLELKGDIVICEATQSFDMNASLFFRNKPDVSIPFRFYGVPRLLFLTSPIIGNETVLLNMASLAEFSIKIEKTLNTPLSALALLYPVVYEHNLWNVREAFEKYTGPAYASREISAEQVAALADAWAELIAGDPNLGVWMTALTSASSAPEAVEAELNGIPSYLRDFIAGGEPLNVKIVDGSEIWQNAAGDTLYQAASSDQSHEWTLALPADETGYAPRVSWSGTTDENGFSFSFSASMLRDLLAFLPPEVDPEEFLEEYAAEEDSDLPSTMLDATVTGNAIPVALPADSSFSVSASVRGALYPNFDLTLNGATKKDGSVSVSVLFPQENAEPAAILSVTGTVAPGSRSVDTVPDFNYKPKQLYGTYNFFSFSEYYVAKFKAAVTKPLVKGLLDFVAEAPTAACQSLLDDLTDSGILNLMSSGQ